MFTLKYVFILAVALTLALIIQAAQGTTTVHNPYTNRLDFVGPGRGLQPGATYYLFQTPSTNAYFTFDGTVFCLYVNSVSQLCYTQGSPQFLLLEDGTYLLLEDGGKIILQ